MTRAELAQRRIAARATLGEAIGVDRTHFAEVHKRAKEWSKTHPNPFAPRPYSARGGPRPS